MEWPILLQRGTSPRVPCQKFYSSPRLQHPSNDNGVGTMVFAQKNGGEFYRSYFVKQEFRKNQSFGKPISDGISGVRKNGISFSGKIADAALHENKDSRIIINSRKGADIYKILVEQGFSPSALTDFSRSKLELLSADSNKVLTNKQFELLSLVVNMPGCKNLFSLPDIDEMLRLKKEKFDETFDVFKKIRNYYPAEDCEKILKAMGSGRLLFSPDTIKRSFECADQLKIHLEFDFWRDFRTYNTLPKYCTQNRYSEAKYLGMLGKAVGRNLKKALDENIDKMNTREDFLIFEFAKNTVSSDKFLKILEEKPNLVKIAALWQDNKDFFNDDYEMLEQERKQFLSKEKDFTEEEVKLVNLIYNSENASDLSKEDKQKLSEIKSYLTPQGIDPEWRLGFISKLSQYGYLTEKFFDLNYETSDVINLVEDGNNPSIVKKLLDLNISDVDFGFLRALSFRSADIFQFQKRLDLLKKLLKLYPGLVIYDDYKLKHVEAFDESAEFLIQAKKYNLSNKSLKLGVEHFLKSEDVRYLKEIEQNDAGLLNVSFENLRNSLPLLVKYAQAKVMTVYPFEIVSHCLKSNYPVECIGEFSELKKKFSPKERKILMLFSKFNRENLENLSLHDLNQLKKRMIKLYGTRKEDIQDTSIGKNIEELGGITQILEKTIDEKVKGREPLLSKSELSQGQFFNLLSYKHLKQAFSQFDAKQFKDGVPLQYSRQAFYKDIQDILSNISSSDLKIIKSIYKFPFDLSVDIVRPCNNIPSCFTDIQKKYCEELNSIIGKFIYKNKVILPDNPDMQKFLNVMMEQMPEFVSVIGKKQHNTHDYSVDVHTLKVLQSCLENPEYENLSAKEQLILNMAVLLHDFGKAEGIVDSGHAETSVVYVKEILKKFKLNDKIKKQIITLVENHHWLGELETDKIDVKSVAAVFRNPSTYKLAKIFAQADLRGVSDDFYNSHVAALNSKKVNLVEKTLDSIFSSAIPIFTSKMVLNADIPSVDGVKVIDVVNSPEILPQIFGQSVKNRDDLRLFVHMVETPTASSFAPLSCLSQTQNNFALSVNYISSKCDSSYRKFQYGVFLDSLLSDIVVASRSNLNSGYKKGKSYLVESFTNSDSYEFQKRKMSAQHIRELLGATEEEYIEIIKQIAEVKRKAQIQDVRVGKKLFKKEDIRLAIESLEKVVLGNGVYHNEVVVYRPKVSGLFAKVNAVEEIPAEMKAYAKKYDLPIIIWGK